MQGFGELVVYNAAFELAADVHELSAAIIAEAYRKKRYPKSFVAKLMEADGEIRKPRFD